MRPALSPLEQIAKELCSTDMCTKQGSPPLTLGLTLGLRTDELDFVIDALISIAMLHARRLDAPPANHLSPHQYTKQYYLF